MADRGFGSSQQLANSSLIDLSPHRVRYESGTRQIHLRGLLRQKQRENLLLQQLQDEELSVLHRHAMKNLCPIQSQTKLCRRLLVLSLLALVSLQSVLQAASSVPGGGTFTAGSGNILTSGNAVVINQSTLRGIINWHTFSIGAGASVQFNNGAGATLNRVTGSATSILGQLLATGNIYILNPEGILIGHGATIHTGGDFLASTLNLPDSIFLSGGAAQLLRSV